MKKIKQLITKIFAFSVFVFCMSTFAFAIDGDGSGNGMLNSSELFAVANNTYTIQIDYTVGPNTLSANGGIKVFVPHGWTNPQVSFSTAPGYVTANTSQTSANLTTTIVNERYIKVVTDSIIASSESINVTIGDPTSSQSAVSKAPDIAQANMEFTIYSDTDGNDTFSEIGTSVLFDVKPASEFGSIAGTVSYSGTETGKVYVVVFSSLPAETDPFVYSIAQTVIDSPGSYTIPYVSTGSLHYVAAYIDTNGNYSFDDNIDVAGLYTTTELGDSGLPVSVTTSLTTSNIDIEITDEPQTGFVSGNITVENFSTTTFAERIVMEFWNNSEFTGTPVRTFNYEPPQSYPIAYNVEINTGTYYMKAWVDSDNNGMGDELPIFKDTPGPVAVLATSTTTQNLNLNLVRAGISGTVNYGGTATGTLKVFVNTGGDIFTVEQYTNITMTEGTSSYAFSISSLTVGLNYSVFALIDKDNDNVYNDLNEPFGMYVSNPLYFSSESGSTGLELTINDPGTIDTGDTLKGTISLDPSITGITDLGSGVHIGAFTDSTMQGAYNGYIKIDSTGTYLMKGLANQQYYYLGAYLDLNGNYNPDPDEPKGKYDPNNDDIADSIFLGDSSIIGIDITLKQASSGNGSVKGYLNYVGTSSGPVRVNYWRNNIDESPDSTITLGTYELFTPDTSNFKLTNERYELPDLLEGSYFIQAYIDLNNNNNPDSDEPQGFYGSPWSIWVNEGMIIDYINIDLAEPSSIELRGQIVYSSSTQSPYGGITVKLYDTKGNWDYSDDVVLATYVSSATWTTGTSNYNFVLDNFSVIPNEQYRLKFTNSNVTSEPEEVWINFYPNGSTYYLNELASWASPIKISPGASYNVSNITYSDTITPDDDGLNDFSEISFDIEVTNLSPNTYNAGSYRLIIDTNKDGLFKSFDWSKVRWDENGNPVYEGEVLDWQELDKIRAQTSDWTYENWLNNSNSMQNITYSEKIMWEGRDSNWKIVPNGDYEAKLQIISKSHWDDPEITFVYDQVVSTITLDCLQVSGNVIYMLEGSTRTFPLEGGRVQLSVPDLWRDTFTDANGDYILSGVKPGTYWMNVEAKGFTSAHKENVSVGLTGATNIDFTMKKGGALNGTISLGETFTAYTDRWGNVQNQLHGWVNAWSERSPNHGWSDFQIYSGTTTGTYEINLPPGTYKVKAEAEGFVSQAQTIEVTAQGGTLDFSLSKAASLKGDVKLPEGETALNEIHIDVGARSSDDRNFSHGWGRIEVGKSSGSFEISNILPGTYTLHIRTQEYAEKQVENIVVPAEGLTLTQPIQFSKGSSITGAITINGNTSNQPTFYHDDGNYFRVWINAYSQQQGYGRGEEVYLSTSTTQTQANYTIAGLLPGTYEIHAYLFGFELDNFPIRVSVAADQQSTQNLTFTEFSGKIKGKVSGFSDHTKVYLTAQLPYWQNGMEGKPIITAIDAQGNYELSGLGTGEYIVSANEYATPPNEWDQGIPLGTVGEATERVNIANGLTTFVNFNLGTSNIIEGIITQDSELNLDLTTSQIKIGAMPLKFQWFNMQETKIVPGQIVEAWTSSATYRIQGIADDIYIVQLNGDLDNDNTPDVAHVRKQIYVSGGKTEQLNFELNKGYMISGKIIRKANDIGNFDTFGIELYNADDKHGSTLVHTELRFTEDNIVNGKKATQLQSLSYQIGPITGGEYIIRVRSYNDNYRVMTKYVEVTNTDVPQQDITLEKGAVIYGKLVDGKTGEPITENSNIQIHCETRPWVEGSWRDTRELSSGTFELKNLPAGNYIVRIQSQESRQQTGKVYASKSLAGIIVPENGTDDTRIAASNEPIKLVEGVTISGRVVEDTNNNKVIDSTDQGLPNIRMAAMPSSSHGDSVHIETKTDGKGYYVFKGIDPDIDYWEILAAARPWAGEGLKVEFGEKRRDNIKPLSTDVNFIVNRANANLEGLITTPEGISLESPFEDNMPVAQIILARQGEIYNDPIGGIEEMSRPDGTFYIQGLVPGTYTMKIMSKGLATSVLTVEIQAGVNTLPNPIALIQGGTITGKIRGKDATGKETKITTSQVEMVVAIEKFGFIPVFGSVKYDSITKEIDTYEIKGVLPNKDYSLALVAEEGKDIVVSTFTVKLTSINQTINQDLIYQDNPPAFILQVKRDPDNDKKFLVSTFITETLLERSPENVLSKTSNASGTLPVDEMVYSQSRDRLEAVYYLDETGLDDARNYFELKLYAHDLEGQDTTQYFQVRTGVSALNQDKINPLIGGQLKLGLGDSTSMYLPGGAFGSDETNNVTAVIQKVSSSELTASGAPKRALSAYPCKAAMKSMRKVQNTSQSGIYDFSVKNVLGSTLDLAAEQNATISIQYTSTTVTETLVDKLDVNYYDTSSNVWRKVKTARQLDETNGKISIQSTMLNKQYQALTDVTAPNVPENIVITQENGNTITLTWNNVSDHDCDGYIIYRSSASNSSGIVPAATTFREIATVSTAETSYTDIGLTEPKYYYSISSYDDTSSPNVSAKSSASLVTLQAPYTGPFVTYIYPSPVNLSKCANATFRYKIPGETIIKIKADMKVYNIAGELVATLFDKQEISTGSDLGTLSWNCTNDDGEKLASGVYVYIFKADKHKEIKKFAIIK
ncbi:carboxypeptidase regulatory-like domain-containing protein [bacterium]